MRHGTTIGDATLDLPGRDEKPRTSVYLHPGQIHVSAEPTSIVTVLGSCVAVCLFDSQHGVGGMNHFLLPHPTSREAPARFGAVATSQLLREVLARGALRANLRAKVFGGGSAIAALRNRNLGAENVEQALRALDEEGVMVAERDVGGSRGRKLVFHTDVGTAWVRTL
jgi:chemotaxis protein CheD